MNSGDMQRSGWDARSLWHVWVFLLSAVLFLAQLLLFVRYEDRINGFITSLDQRIPALQEDHQSSVMLIIRTIRANNAAGRKAVYTFGGSAVREMFPVERDMEALTGMPALKSASSGQNLIDTIRLIDNIETPGSVVIYGVDPLKFVLSGPEQLVFSGYMYGENLKYPLRSQAVERMLAQDPELSVHMLNVPAPLRLFRSGNLFFYFTRLHLSTLADRVRKRRFGPIELNAFRAEFRTVTRGPKEIDYDLKRMRNSIRDEHERLSLNFLLLERACETARAKGHVFVLMDIPRSDVALSHFGAELEMYERYLAEFKRRNPGVTHVAFDYGLYPGNQEYFSDDAHLNDMGREYFAPYIEGGLLAATGRAH